MLPPTDAEVADLLDALRRGLNDAQRMTLDARATGLDPALGERERLETLVRWAFELRRQSVH